MKLEDFSEEEQKRITESRKAYEMFMSKYKSEHLCCPKCGATEYRTTLVAYVFNHESPESYKDENACTCMGCGDKHIFHDRKPKQR